MVCFIGVRSSVSRMALTVKVSPLVRMPRITGRQVYLARRSEGARLHAGVDLASPPGTVVRAPEAGTVAVVGVADSLPPTDGWRWRGYGPEIVLLRGESGTWHLLAHLRNARVAVGERVEAGGTVGEISHLRHVHWEVLTRARPARGQAVAEISLDPLAWLADSEVPYDGRAPEAPSADLRTPQAHRVPQARPTPPPVSTGGQPQEPEDSHGSQSRS